MKFFFFLKIFIYFIGLKCEELYENDETLKCNGLIYDPNSLLNQTLELSICDELTSLQVVFVSLKKKITMQHSNFTSDTQKIFLSNCKNSPLMCRSGVSISYYSEEKMLIILRAKHSLINSKEIRSLSRKYKNKVITEDFNDILPRILKRIKNLYDSKKKVFEENAKSPLAVNSPIYFICRMLFFLAISFGIVKYFGKRDKNKKLDIETYFSTLEELLIKMKEEDKKSLVIENCIICFLSLKEEKKTENETIKFSCQHIVHKSCLEITKGQCIGCTKSEKTYQESTSCSQNLTNLNIKNVIKHIYSVFVDKDVDSFLSQISDEDFENRYSVKKSEIFRTTSPLKLK